MKVRDVMTPNPKACRKTWNLAEAVQLMWENDCGISPVVDPSGRVVGVLTDRDICIALGTQNRRASEVLVSDVARTSVHSCSPDDDILTALKTMGEYQVRRLPVLSDQETLEGLISVNDIIHAAESSGSLNFSVLMRTLKEICGHPLPEPVRP